jgi:hypothetical protein
LLCRSRTGARCRGHRGGSDSAGPAATAQAWVGYGGCPPWARVGSRMVSSLTSVVPPFHCRLRGIPGRR